MASPIEAGAAAVEGAEPGPAFGYVAARHRPDQSGRAGFCWERAAVRSEIGRIEFFERVADARYHRAREPKTAARSPLNQTHRAIPREMINEQICEVQARSPICAHAVAELSGLARPGVAA